MNLFILILFTAFKFNNAMNLNNAQEESFDNIAWLYAQLSLTFDTQELPLDDYFKNNKEQFKEFEEVETFFSDSNLKQHFPEFGFINTATFNPK